MPWSLPSSASVTVVSWSSRRYPAWASARLAGLLSFGGRSSSGGSVATVGLLHSHRLRSRLVSAQFRRYQTPAVGPPICRHRPATPAGSGDRQRGSPMIDHVNTTTDELRADLVLEGGGVKGLGLVGAVSGLYEHGYRFGGPARVAGTSAGAMVAALIAAGMPVPRMVEVMRGLELPRFQDGGNRLRQGFALLTGLGLHPGDYLRNWIAKELEELGVRTFGDLRIDDPASDLPAERAYRLVVVVSDITSGHMVRLPWDYGRYGLDPDKQLVADAVRASASIPFFYRPVQLRLPGDGEVAVHVDGGMLSNFPINLFDRTDGQRPRWPTFGVKLSGRPAPGPWRASWAPVRNLAGLSKALITTMANAHDRVYLDDPAVCARTVFVETFGVKATDFDLSPDQQRDLYEGGRVGAAGFLTGWDFAAYLARYRPIEEPAAGEPPAVVAAGIPAPRS